MCDLEYADDTLLLARTIPQMQSFLASVEKIAAEYGMKLNDTKTELLTKTPGEQTALNVSGVQTTSQLKYLGSMIAWDHPFQTAFLHRAGLAVFAYKNPEIGMELPTPCKDYAPQVSLNLRGHSYLWVRCNNPEPERPQESHGFWFRF